MKIEANYVYVLDKNLLTSVSGYNGKSPCCKVSPHTDQGETLMCVLCR